MTPAPEPVLCACGHKAGEHEFGGCQHVDGSDAGENYENRCPCLLPPQRIYAAAIADMTQAVVEANAEVAYAHAMHCEMDCEGWREAIDAFRESHGTRTPKEFIDEFRAAEERIAHMED